MISSLGLIELNSIAKGYTVADKMLKAGDVELLKANSICPGKFIAMVNGDIGAVRAAVEAGMEEGGENVVDHLVLPNLSQSIIPAISGCTTVEMGDAIGVLEFFSVATAVVAADQALKAANVTLIDLKLGFAIGGKGVVTLTGEVSGVTAAIEAGSRGAKENGLIVHSIIIPRPHPSLNQVFL